MGFIYKITNKINNKCYIGKTSGTIEKRFQEHIKAARYDNNKICLYQAMHKYGIENFIVEEIEECDNSILSSKEIYYIQYFDSYKNGYNMTVGGEGRNKYNYREIVEKYLELGSEKNTASFFQCSLSVVQKACESYNIKIKKGLSAEYWASEEGQKRKEQIRELGRRSKGRIVSQETRQKLSQSLKGKYCGENNPMFGKKFSEEHKQKLVENSAMAKPVRCVETGEVFSSALQASKKVGLKSSAGISKCCSGERKTAGEFHWEFVKGDKQ